MNKIIDSKKNILKICAGNDFSIVVQITEYDTETGAWVNYDLSAVSDVHMTLVAENGKHIKLPVVVREDGTVSAPVQAAYLQKSTYGIELTWVTNDLNRRTYSPCLMQIVTTTAESSSNIAEYESNDAYHFNIKMHADVAVLSIGKIADEYVTEDELDDILTSYATKEYVDESISAIPQVDLSSYAKLEDLSSYATKQYVDDEIANIPGVDLSSYATKQYVDDAIADIPSVDLSSYVTYSYLNTTLGDYVTNGKLAEDIDTAISIAEGYADDAIAAIDLSSYVTLSDLSSYATKQYVDDAISDIPGVDLSAYAKLEDLSSYATKQYVDNEILSIDLSSYATKQYVDNEISSIDLSSYATKQYVDDEIANIPGVDLSSYATKQYVDNEISSIDLSSYATKQYVDDEIANIPGVDLSAYATKQYVDNEISSIDLSSYATLSDLSSYATQQYVDDSVQVANDYTDAAIANIPPVDLSEYATILYVDDAISNIPGTDLSSYATKQYVDDEIASIDLSSYATKQYVDDAISYVSAPDLTSYATKSWSEDKFVLKTDDENRQEAIAAAIASSVQSSYVHNIWSGSQSDYNQLTPDSYTLYVIL